MEVLRQISSPIGLKGHGFSLLSEPGIVWLHILSVSLIAISYLAISLILVLLSRKRRDISVRRIFFHFGIFILARGITHLIDVWAIWHSLNWLAGAVSLLTASVSISAAVILFLSIPKAVTLPSADELQRKNAKLESQAADLIERDRQIESASKSLSLFRELMEQSNDAILIIDPETLRFLDANEEAYKDLGYTREEFLFLSVFDINPNLDGSTILWHKEQLNDNGLHTFETTRVTKSGSKFPMEVSLKVVNLDRTYIVSIGRDITERNRLREAIEASEAEYRSLFEEAPVGLFRAALDGTIVMVNSALVEILGYDSASEVVSKQVGTEVSREDGEPVEFLNLSSATRTPLSCEARWRKRDGSKILVHLTLRYYRDQSKGSFLIQGVVEDRTEQKAISERLRQNQKMEAIGRLAGGVAHDFNNLLVGILGYSQILTNKLNPNHPLRPKAEEIKRAALLARELTAKLLAFSRNEVLQPVVTDIVAVLNGTKDLLCRTIGENIHLAMEFDTQRVFVKLDRSQFEQAILNLAVNARDAMGNGGTLTITMECPQPSVRSFPADNSNTPYVAIRIRDTGPGIPPHVLPHIFEPFFTTKGIGQGSGLGLAMVYAFVKQTGGSIEVGTKLSEGTTVQIDLPVTQEKPPREITLMRPTKTSPLSGTILLVEDDEIVRNLAFETLESAGYNVLVARNGEDAINLARFSETDIHLLLTDVVMPGMAGQDLALKLSSIRPNLHVLFVSGYMDNSAVLSAGKCLEAVA